MKLDMTVEELLGLVEKAKADAGIKAPLNPQAPETAKQAIADINTPAKGIPLA